ncbi:MAG: glutamine synthetase family protein [Cellulosilyticaceae bacterium]
MSEYTNEDILQLAEEQGVEFIRLQFVDILGALKNVAIPKAQLKKALENRIIFDGLSIKGFIREEESDMFLVPDKNSFVILPFPSSQGNIARLICDIALPDGTFFDGNPRYILKNILSKAKTQGYDFYVAPECEFFLFHMDENNVPTTISHDHASYFDLGPTDLGENTRRDMCMALQQIGFKVEATHHEVAPGQHEIDLKYDEALVTADNIVTFKLIVKSVAQRYGLHASFMPKPIYEVNGSGMHCHVSLFKEGTNIFYDAKGEYGLSKEAYYFIGGLLEHAPAITAITNPTVNSYKRLVPKFEAPVEINWSTCAHNPFIRIPNGRDDSTRIELRSPDPSCNPYLAIAAILAAGLDGIENKIVPMSQDVAKGKLPSSLEKAVAALEGDTVIKNALGNHIFENFIKAKKIEYTQYNMQVHPWEVQKYLSKY